MVILMCKVVPSCDGVHGFVVGYVEPLIIFGFYIVCSNFIDYVTILEMVSNQPLFFE